MYDDNEALDWTLISRRGMWNVSIKVPTSLAHLYADGRKRLSTRTPDKSLALKRVPALLNKAKGDFIYKAKSLDPFVELLRPIFEANGISINRWYTHAELDVQLAKEHTWLWEVTKGKLEITAEDLTSKPELTSLYYRDNDTKLMQIAETLGTLDNPSTDDFWYKYREGYLVTGRVGLAWVASRLGGGIPAECLPHLDDTELEELKPLMQPKQPDHTLMIKLLKNPDFASTPLGRAWEQDASLNNDPEVTVITSTTPLYSDLVNPYLESFSKEPSKQHSQRIKACGRVLEYIGDKPLEDYDKVHATEMAKHMAALGFSNSQIGKMITYGRGLFIWATENRNPVSGKPYLNANPWTDLKLADYGKEKRGYLKLEDDELLTLFSLEMPKQEYLLLAILITTGMRLDEAALMTWDRIFVEKDILIFSLLPHKADPDQKLKVKNVGSMRKVPVPTILKPLLAASSQGRLFDYKLDKDGKSENEASKRLMPFIRQVTQHDRKVVHSLRGTFVDLCKTNKVPPDTRLHLTGHKFGDTGSDDYGEGPSLEVRLEALDSLQHPWLEKTMHRYVEL